MARSLKKGPYIDEKLLKKIKNLKPGDKARIKTWSRDCTIVPEMVGFTFGVHNGKDFIEVLIVENSTGSELLEKSSIAAVKEWKFEPALKDGEAVRCWIKFPVKFALE